MDQIIALVNQKKRENAAEHKKLCQEMQQRVSSDVKLQILDFIEYPMECKNIDSESIPWSFGDLIGKFNGGFGGKGNGNGSTSPSPLLLVYRSIAMDAVPMFHSQQEKRFERPLFLFVMKNVRRLRFDKLAIYGPFASALLCHKYMPSLESVWASTIEPTRKLQNKVTSLHMHNHFPENRPEWLHRSVLGYLSPFPNLHHFSAYHVPAHEALVLEKQYSHQIESIHIIGQYLDEDEGLQYLDTSQAVLEQLSALPKLKKLAFHGTYDLNSIAKKLSHSVQHLDWKGKFTKNFTSIAFFSHLKSLEILAECTMSFEGAAKHMPLLERLAVNFFPLNGRMQNFEKAKISEISKLPKLTSLSIEIEKSEVDFANRVKKSVIIPLVSRGQLRSLSFHASPLSDTEVQCWCDTARGSRLEKVLLGCWELSDKTWLAIVRNPLLRDIFLFEYMKSFDVLQRSYYLELVSREEQFNEALGKEITVLEFNPDGSKKGHMYDELDEMIGSDDDFDQFMSGINLPHF